MPASDTTMLRILQSRERPMAISTRTSYSRTLTTSTNRRNELCIPTCNGQRYTDGNIKG